MNARFVPVVLAGLAVLCLVAMATFAEAQEGRCGPRGELVKVLAGKYQEAPAGIGTVGPTHIAELFVSPKQTWTMLATDQNGLSCIVAAGKDWEFDTTAFDDIKKGEDM